MRTLLKNPHIEITTPHLLFEIKGITDILNRSDLEMSSTKEEKKILGSIKNLRKKRESNSEHTESVEMIKEINALMCKVDIDKYKFEKENKDFHQRINQMNYVKSINIYSISSSLVEIL